MHGVREWADEFEEFARAWLMSTSSWSVVTLASHNTMTTAAAPFLSPIAVVAVTVTCLVVARVEGAAPTPCASLTQLKIPDAAVSITQAEIVPPGPPPAPAFGPPYEGTLPAYCRASRGDEQRIGRNGRPYAIGYLIALPGRGTAASHSRAAAVPTARCSRRWASTRRDTSSRSSAGSRSRARTAVTRARSSTSRSSRTRRRRSISSIARTTRSRRSRRRSSRRTTAAGPRIRTGSAARPAAAKA